ncbi:DsbA family protein [Bacillus timonensis]|nr:DsbA family protein [Bacillus timonensis]
MAEAPLFEAIKGKDVKVEWMPFELRPYPNEQLSPKSDYIQRGWHGSVKPMSERFGVQMVLPDIDPVPYTHLAHEGYQYALEHDKGLEYALAAFKGYWQRELDISQVDVLAELAAEVGLDKEDFTAKVAARTYQQKHREALRHAYQEAQITAVPTFFIGNRRVQGLHTKEMLEKIINEQYEGPISGDACGIDGC